jgi:two-component system, NtrC family, sensor histidine kinase PilS
VNHPQTLASGQPALAVTPTGTPHLTESLGTTTASQLQPLNDSSPLIRLWQTFMTARIAVAAVLVILQLGLWSAASGGTPVQTAWLLGLCLVYLASTVLTRFLMTPVGWNAKTMSMQWQWFGAVGVDIGALATLHIYQSNAVSYAPLMALPVLFAAVLGHRMLGLGTAAAATLALLLEAVRQSLWLGVDSTTLLPSAALTGSAFLVLAGLANELMRRLMLEARSASDNLTTAQLHQRINQAVTNGMAEGIMALDHAGKVLMFNPSAQRLLRLDEELGRDHSEVLTLLQRIASQAWHQTQPDATEWPVPGDAGAVRKVRIRSQVATPYGDAGAKVCIFFIEDLREIEARLRSEKMVVMGRMSAALAHEIRNPLAAISQANQLLIEDATDPVQNQLTHIIEQNARRVARTIDEVLELAREPSSSTGNTPATTDLHATLPTLVAEWQLNAAYPFHVDEHYEKRHLVVHFDVDHLRRILVNLLDNAARYAKARDGAIMVATRQHEAFGAWLLVWSDAQAVEPGVAEHLFEPFFSSESRSSGLGLYICRELCERHQARITYERCSKPQPIKKRRLGSARPPVPHDTPSGNGFFVFMRSQRYAESTQHANLLKPDGLV